MSQSSKFESHRKVTETYARVHGVAPDVFVETVRRQMEERGANYIAALDYAIRIAPTPAVPEAVFKQAETPFKKQSAADRIFGGFTTLMNRSIPPVVESI